MRRKIFAVSRFGIPGHPRKADVRSPPLTEEIAAHKTRVPRASDIFDDPVVRLSWRQGPIDRQPGGRAVEPAVDLRRVVDVTALPRSVDYLERVD